MLSLINMTYFVNYKTLSPFLLTKPPFHYLRLIKLSTYQPLCAALNISCIYEKTIDKIVNDSPQLNATQDLRQQHLTLRRVRDSANRCSNRHYARENIPFEDLKIISVVIE